MSLPSFNKMMTHKVTLRKRKRNEAGDFSDIATTPNLKGFVEYRNDLKIKKDNEEINAKAIVYLKDDCGIDINYPYWMIDQTSPYIRSDMEVLQIEPVDHPLNAGQTHHYEIIVR